MKWKRTDIINLVAEKIGAKTYLEIGVQNPDNNFNFININKRIGVDPSPVKNDLLSLGMTSNCFFNLEENSFIPYLYDLIFIDGDHSYKQSLKDVENSLCRLSENGVIIMHDVNPSRRYMQVEPKPDIAHKWCGGCWKTFAKLRMTRPNLWMAMIPDDLGCGIIKFGKQICYPTSPLNWNLFTEHKQELMNIITVDQLKEMSFKH